MKAMISKEPGGPETLEMTEMSMPEPKAGELLIQVHAAGVNFPDTLIIKDMYQFKPPRPFAPGGEVCGEIIGIGEGVAGFEKGERVLALTGHGAFATHMTLTADRAVKVPDGMPSEDAACFIFTYGTSHHALKDRAQLRPGETLLILGAAGGVGAAAIELAKAAGATVIAAVSTEDKARFCSSIGADHTIIYPRDMTRDAQRAFSDQVKALTNGQGADVIYDAVGGDYAEPALRAIGWQGRYLVVGFPAGIPKLPLNLPLLKGSQIIGVFWGAAVRHDPNGHAENMADLFQLYAEGKIRPRIHARFPLAQAADALNMMSDRKVMGKVIVAIHG
ncbi:NADPH:quinone oxidoreductase family protein [Loktanella sp. S4079]|uniref:NADPH:quinone oxidoreductase family protein n=1 Tax=Loktanella sp. S4079 TaxID=579483 RepID=UPI0005FA7EA2|nr:NADPH:quinone oxidoreductase family protein [Loktanella sp. S4079]KJZ18435.1 NADPH:quinone oxidoreductase [Loktanella sp. S4079]